MWKVQTYTNRDSLIMREVTLNRQIIDPLVDNNVSVPSVTLKIDSQFTIEEKTNVNEKYLHYFTLLHEVPCLAEKTKEPETKYL